MTVLSNQRHPTITVSSPSVLVLQAFAVPLYTSTTWHDDLGTREKQPRSPLPNSYQPPLARTDTVARRALARMHARWSACLLTTRTVATPPHPIHESTTRSWTGTALARSVLCCVHRRAGSAGASAHLLPLACSVHSYAPRAAQAHTRTEARHHPVEPMSAPDPTTRTATAQRANAASQPTQLVQPLPSNVQLING